MDLGYRAGYRSSARIRAAGQDEAAQSQAMRTHAAALAIARAQWLRRRAQRRGGERETGQALCPYARRIQRRVAATVAFAIVHRPSAWHRRAPESEWTVRAARRRAGRDDRANNGQRAAQCVARARNASPHPHRAASRKAAAYGPTPAPYANGNSARRAVETQMRLKLTDS